MTTILTLIGAIFAAVIAKVIADDARTLVPKISKIIIICAVKQLPPNHVERFMEEWLSHNDEIDEITGKLVHSLSLLIYGARRASEELSSFRSGYLGKRALDLILVLLMSPSIVSLVILFAAISAKDGPPFIRLKMIGKGGKTFYQWSMRTFHPETFKPTPFGRILRVTSLYELPHLWSVLKGDMSLVGPRAYASGKNIDVGVFYYGQKPGIIGNWEGQGGNGLCELANQEYTQTVSFKTDINILVMTINVVFAKKAC